MKQIKLCIICILLITIVIGCGSKNNVAVTSKNLIDKDLTDDVSVQKCYYYEEKNATYIIFHSSNHGEDDAVITLDENKIYYGSVYSTIAKDDYDKIIEYGDYVLYSFQILTGDEDWVEIEVE